MLGLFPRRGRNPGLWKGHTLKAVDKATVVLPERPALFRKFGAHRGCRGLGPVSVELCCVLAVLPRIPLAWVTAKANASEHVMVKRLLRKLRKGDLLLIDNGFYCFKLFSRLRQRACNFLIPVAKNTGPKIIRTLGPGDYLVEIQDSDPASEETMVARLLYVYRKGFRRRRILTGLLDPVRYPADELADLYHRRWDIETFYRDFKDTLKARTWHCQTPDSFQKELTMHMIATVLIRSTMLEAARRRRIAPARLSFSRAVTEARVFLKRLAGAARDVALAAYGEFVSRCARHLVNSKPGRTFPRDQQERRRKARGIDDGRRGRRRPTADPFAEHNAGEETLTTRQGETYALS